MFHCPCKLLGAIHALFAELYHPLLVVVAAKDPYVRSTGMMRPVLVNFPSAFRHLMDAGPGTGAQENKVKFRCLSSKKDFYIDKDTCPMVKTATRYGDRWKYVSESPYATHSVRTGNKLGPMYCTVPKQDLRDRGM